MCKRPLAHREQEKDGLDAHPAKQKIALRGTGAKIVRKEGLEPTPSLIDKKK